MDAGEFALVLAAGLAAGTVNTIVGSGSLITFPTLLAVGYPPVVANVSNTLGLVPGSASGALGYRRELRGQARRCVALGSCTAAGALLGGVLLLALPESVFDAVVPLLILLACVLMALKRRLAPKPGTARGRGHAVAAGVAAGLTGIYGGYFGAGQGIILISLLALLVQDDLQRLNALKNVLAGVANAVSAALFVFVAHIAWEAAAAIAAGSIVGGQLGATLGRRLPEEVLRIVVVVGGTAVAIVLLVT